MKKLFSVIMIMMMLLLVACGGKTAGVNRDSGESTVYSQAEIENAMDVVVDHFSKNFEGCELTDLWYEEEFSVEQAADWAAQYGADEAIVLLSTFKVDGSGGDGSLNPNSTYNNWTWILVRSKGNWELKTWGY